MRTIFILIFFLIPTAGWAQDRWVRMTNGDWDRIEKEVDALKPGGDTAAIKETIERAWKKFEKATDKNSAEAKACMERGKAIEKKLAERSKAGDAKVKEAGDVDAQLELLNRHFPDGRLDPPILKEPWTSARVAEWTTSIQELRSVQQNGLEYLKRIKGLGTRDSDEKFKYFLRQFETYIPNNIDQGVNDTLRSFDNIIRMYVSIAVTDANTKDEKTILEMQKSLSRGIVSAEARAYVQKHLQGKEDEAGLKELEKMRGELKKLEGKTETLIKNARLPKGLDKPDLAKIAEETLKAAKIEFTHLRVTEDKTPHAKIVWDSGAFHEVAWETFAVAVVEKKDGRTTVFFYSFNRYSKRQSNLVVNQWIVLPWMESYRYAILDENLDK